MKNESLKCTRKGCKALQDGEGEFCPKHYPKAKGKRFVIDLEEIYFGQFEIVAKNKAEARKKFWKHIGEYDMGSIMGDSLGVEIKRINLAK